MDSVIAAGLQGRGEHRAAKRRLRRVHKASYLRGCGVRKCVRHLPGGYLWGVAPIQKMANRVSLIESELNIRRRVTDIESPCGQHRQKVAAAVGLRRNGCRQP